jgi:hypothetical protein
VADFSLKEDPVSGGRKMMDARAARVHAHRSNIRRYRTLLETHLTDVERDYIEGRLLEERATLQALQTDEAHRL